MKKYLSIHSGWRQKLTHILQMVENGLAMAGKPLFIATAVLIGIWSSGRIMEALFGNVVFDTVLTYWFGVIVFVIIGLWTVSAGIASMRSFRKRQHKKIAGGISWLFFLLLIGVVLSLIQGYRVASSGLFAALAGSTEISKEASFLLIKYHPANPMLAINLLVIQLMGAAKDMEPLRPYLWGWNLLFIFLMWSCAYGILLMRQKNNLGPKAIHLFLAATGIAGLIIVKAVSTPTFAQMIMFQAAVSILFVFQALLAYSSIRTSAVSRPKEKGTSGPYDIVVPEIKRPPEKPQDSGLPPSAVHLALLIYLVLPVLTDLQNQFSLALTVKPTSHEISMGPIQRYSQYATIVPISLRSNALPIGRDQAVLLEGGRMPVIGAQLNRIQIGSNKWVPAKRIKPLYQGAAAVEKMESWDSPTCQSDLMCMID